VLSHLDEKTAALKNATAQQKHANSAAEPLEYVRREKTEASTHGGLPLKEEQLNIGEHSNMKKEIQQGKCLPNIQTEADFQAASERGYHAASNYLKQNPKPFSEWTLDDYTKLHKLYFGEIYPHAGQMRPPGDLAAFNGRVGADSKNIPAELNLLMSQVQHLTRGLGDMNTPTGLTERLNVIAFAHARLALIHPFQDGNGRLTRLIATSLEKELLPNHQVTNHVPRAVYMNAMKALPSNLGPLMNYHAERYDLRPSSLKAVRPLFPVQVTFRD